MKKVLIGMSGGVDSSVSALLLKEKGYEVIGATMKLWESDDECVEGGCCNLNSTMDAKRVCDVLNIPHYVLNFKEEFNKCVIQDFISEYKKCRTPNPCIECNKYMKFGAMYEKAKELGCDYIATGHYARIVGNKLLRGVDSNKDQTYFLAQVSADQLKDVLFPVGDLEKSEVREIADKIKLPTAKKKDSTGICFIGERNYQKFLHNYLKPNPGDIVDIDSGEIIGTHNGLMNYTIGQRRNVGVSGFKDKHFVVGKDVEKNILFVAFGDNPETLYSDECIIEDVNLISPNHPTFATAKFRYRGPDYEVMLEYLDNNEIRVSYPEKVPAVTPGQACVIYLGEQCIGSGIIKTVRKNGEKLWYL